MNDYWGPPRHDLPPVHALPNPTDPYQHGGTFGAAGNWGVPASAGAPLVGGGGGAVFAMGGSIGRSKRSIPIAILLAVVLGPLGLFYVNIASGIIALIAIPVVVRSLAFAAAAIVGGGMGTVGTIAVPILWCITVPWAIIGVRVRNARIDRTG